MRTLSSNITKRSFTMAIVSFFIDGYNLYHSITGVSRDNKKQICRDAHGNPIKKLKKYRWLDLYHLASLKIRPNEVLHSVNYFTAVVDKTKFSARAKKHRAYINALKASNCNVEEGYFQHKEKTCFQCKNIIQMQEEKQTDVHIATKLLSYGLLREIDVAYIICGDNDLKPAYETLLEFNDHIHLRILLPPYSKNQLLRIWANDPRTPYKNRITIVNITEQDIINSQLEDLIPNTGILKPASW